MNFTNADFDAFERDLQRAIQATCNKYQVKLKNMRISYGTVDFDMKLTFEKCFPQNLIRKSRVEKPAG